MATMRGESQGESKPKRVVIGLRIKFRMRPDASRLILRVIPIKLKRV